MPQQWFTVRAQAELKAVQVSTRGIIGEWGLSDREFVRDVGAAGDDIELIEVTINSQGGDVEQFQPRFKSNAEETPKSNLVMIYCLTNRRLSTTNPSSFDRYGLISNPPRRTYRA